MKLYTIGLDIGGSEIKGILLAKKNIVDSFIAKTPKTEKEFKETLRVLLQKFTAHQGKTVRIGIGVAGVIKKTKVVWSPNIPYLKNFEFREVFGRPLRLKVDNDARAILKGEVAANNNYARKKIMLFTIGTGIGRAFGEKGRVRTIKKFEYPEIWEKEYQKIRNMYLSRFLAKKLSVIIKIFKPQIILIGGGVAERKNFFAQIKKEFLKNGIKTPVKKSALQDFETAFGAALLFK
jgi:predicted NBD/HSP70 family sugar kinase